jgi:hypothetical protein
MVKSRAGAGNDHGEDSGAVKMPFLTNMTFNVYVARTMELMLTTERLEAGSGTEPCTRGVPNTQA